MINKAVENPKSKVVIAPERIQSVLKRPVEGVIPLVDETIILNAIQSGVPVVASDRDTSKSPIKELIAFSNHLFTNFMGADEFFEESLNANAPDTQTKKTPWSRRHQTTLYVFTRALCVQWAPSLNCKCGVQNSTKCFEDLSLKRLSGSSISWCAARCGVEQPKWTPCWQLPAG